jgi:hypothetical protein
VEYLDMVMEVEVAVVIMVVGPERLAAAAVVLLIPIPQS